MGLHYEDQRAHPGPVIILNVCELCGHSFESQYAFFKHLKEHYEPEFVNQGYPGHVPEPIPDDGDSDDNDGFVNDNEQFEEIFANNINKSPDMIEHLEIFIKNQESRAESYQTNDDRFGVIDGMMMIEDPGPGPEMDHNVASGSGIRNAQEVHEILDAEHNPHHYHPHQHHHHLQEQQQHHHSHPLHHPQHLPPMPPEPESIMKREIHQQNRLHVEEPQLDRIPVLEQHFTPLPDPLPVETNSLPKTKQEIIPVPPPPLSPLILSPESPPPPPSVLPEVPVETIEEQPELVIDLSEPVTQVSAVKKVAKRKAKSLAKKREKITVTYPCEKCDRSFISMAALRYHLNKHETRKVKCEHCDKMFHTKSTLQVHLRIHLDKRPFGCEKCELRFRQKNDLNYHMASKHTAIKDYRFQCEHCKKKFARKYSLNLHTKVHTGTKDHQCEICSKSFRASSYLDVHRRTHTADRPYECPLCAKKFSVKADVRRHLVQVHKKSKAASLGLLSGETVVVD